MEETLYKFFIDVNGEKSPMIENVRMEDVQKINEILYPYGVRVFSAPQK